MTLKVGMDADIRQAVLDSEAEERDQLIEQLRQLTDDELDDG